MKTKQKSLLVKPKFDNQEYINLTPEKAQWEYLSFAARKMKSGEQWTFQTEENELAIVVLGGVCSVHSNRGKWERIGRRPNVFAGMPYALYLPRQTEFSLKAIDGPVDIGYGWVPTDEDHPAKLVTPDKVQIEIRGGDNFTRQINNMIPPGFDNHRLVVVEVYTPGGNWSSYPGHKHDCHRINEQGKLLEADLEEIYFYKIDKPEDGYAIQRVYNDDGSLDELILARNNHLVKIPEGYHPVVSPPGYNTYYLNFLAGSAQSLQSHDDPQYAWVKDQWRERDVRVPMVSMKMET
jgi:5-deoxy-glucuronate isomerase